jgi:CrcB protein
LLIYGREEGNGVCLPSARGRTAQRADDSLENKENHMLALKQMAVVALGGALGSIARYKVGAFVLHHTSSDFPVSTFSVNVVGCFVIGALAALVEHHDFFSPMSRLFLFTGLVGGFTTFSAFEYETAFLMRRDMAATSLLYVGLSVLCGLAAVFAGLKSVDLIFPPHY